MSSIFNHSSDSAEFISYVPNANWDKSVTTVKKALDNIGTWALADTGLPVASTTTKGIIAVATDAEVDLGTDKVKTISPYSLKRVGTKPEATVAAFGTTRYASDAESVNATLNNRTITPYSLNYVLVRKIATEATIGMLKIATSDLAKNGADDTTIMTPLKTKVAIQALVPIQATGSETVQGTVKIATTQQTIDGTIREGFAVSPFAFANANATETKFGTVKLAAAADMKSDSTKYVSTARFRAQRATETEVGTVILTKVLGDSTRALSGATPVILTTGGNTTGRLKLNNVDYITRNELPEPGLPIGFICMVTYGSADNYGGNYMIADGRSLSKTAYPELFAKIGYTFGGSGDNFNIPNMTDLFVRAAGPNRAVGSIQQDALQNIKGDLWGVDKVRNSESNTALFKRTERWSANIKNGSGDDWGFKVVFDASRVVRTADETRPKNIAMWYVIKVK